MGTLVSELGSTLARFEKLIVICLVTELLGGGMDRNLRLVESVDMIVRGG